MKIRIKDPFQYKEMDKIKKKVVTYQSVRIKKKIKIRKKKFYSEKKREKVEKRHFNKSEKFFFRKV